MITIQKAYLQYRSWKVEGFIVNPKAHGNTMACITHGYTSHKGQLLNWATRLAQEGVYTGIFDLPGHYLGSFNEVHNFHEFSEHAQDLFFEFIKIMTSFAKRDYSQLVLSGHSLGGLLALKASEHQGLKSYSKIIIPVAIGLDHSDTDHIFQSNFYKSTLEIRQQLVSESLNPQNIFPWIKKEKETLGIMSERIHIISGSDDVVAPSRTVETLRSHLQLNNNIVTTDILGHLPHHLPEIASPHICSFLRKINFIQG